MLYLQNFCPRSRTLHQSPDGIPRINKTAQRYGFPETGTQQEKETDSQRLLPHSTTRREGL